MPTALQAPPKIATFRAAREEYRAVKKGRRAIRGAEGQQVDEEPGEAVQFRNHRFAVPLDGEVTLEDGQRVDSGPILEWLRRHKANGDHSEGFWEEDVIAPEPSAEELSRLLGLAEDGEGLRAFIAEEEEGYAREKLLVPARDALSRLEGVAEHEADTKASDVPEGLSEPQNA